MKNFGREAPKSSLSNLRSCVVACLFVASAGSYINASASQRPEDPPTDLGRVVAHGIGYFPGRFQSFSWGLMGFSGGVDTDVVYEPAPIPDAKPIDSSSNPDGPCEGNPVVVANGNKIESETDFLSATDDELSLVRTYNHYAHQKNNFSTILGAGWLTQFDASLGYSNYEPGACYNTPSWPYIPVCDTRRANTIHAYRPSGKIIKFDRAADGRYVTTGDSNTVLTWTSEGLQYSDGQGGIEMYAISSWDSNTHMSWRRNGRGDVWTYTYLYDFGTALSRVTHNSGKYISFNRDDALKLTSITDQNGKVHKYDISYDGNTFRLSSYTAPDSTQPINYHYESSSFPGALTGKSYGSTRFSTFQYDAAGRVSGSYHAGLVDRYTYSYGPYVTRVTNPLGRVTTYGFSDGKLSYISGAQTSNCPATSVSNSYDDNGFLKRTTDAEGTVTLMESDTKGRVTSKIEGNGSSAQRTTTYRWDDATDRILSMEVAGYKRVDYTYHPNGRTQSIRTTNLTSNGKANQSREVRYAYSYHANGVVSKVTISSGGMSESRSYNSLGNLTSTVSTSGHTTKYSLHDGYGRPGRVVDPNGGITEVSYNPLGKIVLLRRKHAAGWASESYTYNAAGMVTSHRSTGGVASTFSYSPALRLTERRSTVGGVVYRQAYTYDLAGNMLRNDTYAGSTLAGRDSYEYDEADQIRSIVGNSGRRTSILRNKRGQITSTTTNDTKNGSRVERSTYDALGRRSSIELAPGYVTTFAYDPGDNIVSVKNGDNLVKTYKYDGFGQLWASSDPDRGSISINYTSAGLRSSLKIGGNTISYAYDSKGRTLSASSGGLVHAYAYDDCAGGLGRVCQISDASGTMSFTYALHGALASKSQTVTGSSVLFTQKYGYDAAGRLSSISYPGNVSVGYGYVGDQVSAMSAKVGGTTRSVFSGRVVNPFVGVSALTHGNGLSAGYKWDLDGRLSSVSLSGASGQLHNLSLAYSNSNDVVKMNEASPSVVRDFTYAASGALLRERSSASNYSDFSYDNNFNRTLRSGLVSGAPMALQSIAIVPGTNRISSINGVGFQYDTSGNAVRVGSKEYWYDSFGSLERMVDGANVVNYAVNALGQRVWRDKGGQSSRQLFVYGINDQIDAEYSWAGGRWTHYLRLGSVPIALVRGGALYHVHNDHLDRPSLVTNASASVVWRARNNAFGREVVQDSIGGLNIGLPGQFWDADAGLWYNNGRNYDSNTGRYIESDPIGALGGSNPYVYVSSNPVSRFDSSGLACNSDGCWNTQRELSYAIAGDAAGYYQEACNGGDPYACRGYEVATMSGEGFTKALTLGTNARLMASMVANYKGCPLKMRERIKAQMESVRRGLVLARVGQLANSPLHPRKVTRGSIAAFHRAVFEDNGASPDVFGGETWDKTGKLGRLVYNWCPDPSCSD